MSGAVSPELGQANTEIPVYLSLIPKDDVLQLITLCVVAHNKTLIILCALIHDLAEELERRKCRSVVFINTLPVVEIRLTQNEHIVHIRSQNRGHTERVLHSNQEEYFDPATVQEEIANIEIPGPRVVVETVVQDQEGSGVNA